MKMSTAENVCTNVMVVVEDDCFNATFLTANGFSDNRNCCPGQMLVLMQQSNQSNV